MSQIARTFKNVTKGYSHVQVTVRNATSNDAWGPSGTDMGEIATLTFNNPSDFYEIMDMLDKRLNDKGKNWRHVLKSLKVLDYCLHEGSELVVTWARKNIYIIKTLREFQYVDEEGRDVGQNVRTSARELTSLILDEDRLRAERADRKLWKNRVQGIDENPPPIVAGPDRAKRQTLRREDSNDEEMKLAIEASKAEAEEDAKRRARGRVQAGDMDDDLAKAIKLSKEEEDSRRRELEDQNAASLFDDGPLPSQPQPTGYNQGYQQQTAVDWFGNPLQQQPQSTGYLNNQYSVQPQQTAYQTGFPGNGMMNGYQAQPQPSAFDQFGQAPQAQFGQPQQQFGQPQQVQPPQQPQQFMPQQTAFQPTNNFGAQPQQSPLQAGTNNPWATPSSPQPQQQESLKPLPTGSNNPFASKVQQQRQATSSPFGRQNAQPSLGTLYESQNQSFQQPSQPNPIMNFQAPQQPQYQQQQQQQPQYQQAQQPQYQQPQQPVNPHHAKLDSLLASGAGQDTFGNVGQTRIPAQHTAPGMFVNSAGIGQRPQQTGSNPFLTQAYTGMQYQPQQPSYGRPAGQGSLIDL